jgi:KRAB domain-containing zinc finger protein
LLIRLFYRHEEATSSKTLLDINQADQPIKQSFECDFCGRKFGAKPLLTQHLKVHYDRNKFECSKCKQTFMVEGFTKTRENATICTDKLRSLYKCELCGIIFKGPKEFHTHKFYHNDSKNHKCRKCEKSFPTRSQLKQHLEHAHNSDRKHKCDICQKPFKTKHETAQHRAIHSDAKQFKCKECGKEFKWKSNLYSHVATHSSERKFKCGVCGKSAKLLTNLRKHMKIHSKVENMDFV